MFDPKTDEEKYYADCNDAFNDNEIVGCVSAESTYDDDDYVWVDYNDPRFDDIRAGWPDGGCPPHGKWKRSMCTSVVATSLVTTSVIIPMLG